MLRIAHPTDFSPQSGVAFLHALRLALAAKGSLDLLHVGDHGQQDAWQSFPHVRQALSQWGVIEAQARPADIEPKLGIRISKIVIDGGEVLGAISDFLVSHRPDLVVVATHGRQGVNRWLNGSVSEQVSRRAHVPTLYIGPHSQSFVDIETGRMMLGRILVPVAAAPSPRRAFELLSSLLSPVGVSDRCFEPVHVIEATPDNPQEAAGRRIELLHGPVVETIVRVAGERGVDVIAMPTVGGHGFVDGLRGSTTSRVIARAPCPVLTLPLVGG